MTDRGERALEFLVPSEPLPDGRLRLRAPRSLTRHGRKAADIAVYPVSEDLDKEVRQRIKNLEEGTATWEIEYQKVMDQMKQRHGIKE